MSNAVVDISKKTGLPEDKVREVFRLVTESIKEAILDGDEFRFGDLGRFRIDVGDNPNAMVVFTPSDKLVREVNSNFVENRDLSI